MITKEILTRGYKDGVVKLEESPNEDGVVCRIGEYWFYFGGSEAEECMTVEEYNASIPTETIIDEIYQVLDDFANCCEIYGDEYNYYEAYLNEHLKTKSKDKYRRIIDLTDEEIRFIINDIFDPKVIENIQRDVVEDRITCDITTDGWNDGETAYAMTDELSLSMPSAVHSGIEIDFSVNPEEILKWKQFCIAKGCNTLFKNNPYIEE